MPAATHHDEDFINKSLLASLDAQADAEPNNYRSSFRPRHFYQQQQDPFYNQYDYHVQLSSQTPYGPHVPAGVPQPPQQPIPSASASSTTASGEEISTIFVVGFPEDMSEREFQNMFTFSPGFEAATLKIPNKEYTAYNGLLPSSSNPAQRAYATDPYNLGGVVLDGARDGMASWPAAQHDDLAAHHYNLSTGLPLAAPNPNPALAASSNTLNLPQRKQIIGFAKFRTREEALSARDVLQGRRVDIEKGAVLKAEMAKKNLHTKRGVGPVPGSLPPSTGGPSNPTMQIQQQQPQHDTTLFGPPSDFVPSSLPSSSQQGSIPALSRLGWRDSVSVPLSVGSSTFAQQQIAESSVSNSILNGLSSAASTSSPAAEDDRKRDSTSTSLLTLGSLSTGLQSLSLAPTASSSTPTIGSNAHQLHLPLLSARGARERAAADDDEQQWRRREENLRDIKDMKLRAMDSVAYDAFHRVSGTSPGAPSAGVIGAAQTASGMSRQSSSSTSLSLSTPLTSSTSNTPWTPNSVPTTVPSADGENGRKLDDGGADEENIELETEVNRRREEDDDYETRDPRDEQEQVEQERGTEDHLSGNTNNVTNTTTNEIVGPWDRINVAGSYAAVARPAARTGTGSERSTSPPPSQPSSSSFSMAPNLGMNGASSSHQHLGLHQQHYSNQYGYHQTPQPSSQVQNQSYQNQYQHLHMHQQQMLQQHQQHREREAFMHQYQQQQQQQQQYRSTQSESGESTGDPTSSTTNPVGYIGASAARLGMLNTTTNGNAHPNTNGNGIVLPPPPTSSASSSSSMTLSRHQSAFSGNGVGVAGGTSGVGSAPSSGSTSSSSNNGGNTSPQLPSPTSGGSSGGSSSTTSLTSAISVGGSGTAALRGTVDQNPPINTLYVGNLPTSPPQLGYPADFLEDILREVFSARPGYRKLCFRHKANGPMCFVEFEDVHYAAKALSEMSGNTLRGHVKNGIRLSYSKNPLGVRTPTSAGGNNGGPTLQQQQQLMQTLHNAQYQQQQQQQAPSMMHQYSQPPPPSSASSNGQDTFHSHSRLADDFAGHHQSHHHRVQLPTSILRRDSALSPTFASSLSQAQAQAFGASPNNNNGPGSGGSGNALPNGGASGYFSSPPPRFYTTSPPGISSTQLTGTSNAFVPRSSAAMANGIFGAGYSTAFSPFGVPFGSGGTGGGESGFGGGHPQHIPSEQQQQHHQQQQHQQQSDD